MKFIKVFPSSIELPAPVHEDNFKNVFNIVVSFAVLLYQGSYNLDVHYCRVNNVYVGDIE